MTIDKAIEILLDLLNTNFIYSGPEKKDSLKLGIEALKRQLAKNTLTFAAMMKPLPGETEGY